MSGEIPWYRLEGQAAADAVIATFKSIDERQSYRTDRNQKLLRMYSAVARQGFGSAAYADTTTSDSRLQLNVIDAVIDTAQSLLATNRPRPYFLTVAGNEEMQRRAKNLNKFALGQFLACDIYDHAQLVFLDAATLGTGFLKIYEDEESVDVERVFTQDVVVDDIEARYAKPRNLYQHGECSKSVLQSQYPEHVGAIEVANVIREDSSYSEALEDPVGWVEAWHLPSAGGAGDGKHVIAVDGAALLEEEWDEDDFPFAIFRIGLQQLGFWGAGWISKLRGIQREINSILMKIQRHLKLGSTKVFVESEAKAAKMTITNQEFEVVPYSGGRPPVIAAIEPISPTYAEMVEYLYAKAFELTGVNQLTAQSQKPPGLSGVAIRSYNDLQSARFQHLGQNWERLFIDSAKRMIQLARQINENGEGSYKIMAKSKNGLEEIKWSEVSLDDDKFIIQAWPASLLPNSPQGKLQTITELTQAFPQLQPYALSLLTELPDLDAVTKLINAPHQIMDLIISEILKGGAYIPPEPMFDLQMGVQQMQLAYVRAKIEKVSKERVGLMERWIKQALDLMNPPQEQAPPEMPVSGMPPGSQPPVPPGIPPQLPPGPGGPIPTPPEAIAAGQMIP